MALSSCVRLRDFTHHADACGAGEDADELEMFTWFSVGLARCGFLAVAERWNGECLLGEDALLGLVAGVLWLLLCGDCGGLVDSCHKFEITGIDALFYDCVTILQPINSTAQNLCLSLIHI